MNKLQKIALAVVGFVVLVSLNNNNNTPEQRQRERQAIEQTDAQVHAQWEAEEQAKEAEWFARNERSPDDPHIRRCMGETGYPPWFCDDDAVYEKCRDQGVDPKRCAVGSAERRFREQRDADEDRKLAIAQERVDEARRALRRSCAADPIYAARNPETCSQ